MLDSRRPAREIEAWLRERRPDRLSELWRAADACRARHVGAEIHLRGLIEVSNHCVRSCTYCGLRAPNDGLCRYRMAKAEVLAAAQLAVRLGYGTVVLQSGEDYGITAEWLAGVVRNIKRATPLAVTLSMGERPHEDLAVWRGAGADRYLLRFETSDRALYDAVHPPLRGRRSDRIAILRDLQRLGYEIGGGVMVGLPGQSYTSLAGDIDLFRRMDMDMVGLGPYIPNPEAPLGRGEVDVPAVAPDDRVPNTEEMTYKVLALTRLVCPEANIPSTTALATVNESMGRELGLRRGANVFMPNVTPRHYRELYRIYPNKASLHETALPCEGWLAARLRPIGRRVGRGPGGRRRAGARSNAGDRADTLASARALR